MNPIQPVARRDRGGRADRSWGLGWLAAVGGSAVLCALLVSGFGDARVAMLVGVVPLAVAVVWMSPSMAVVTLAVWLVFLGLIRRLVPGSGTAGAGDPLLLVEPAVLLLLLVVAAGRGAFKERTRLVNAVLLLSGIVAVEALNPKQGGLLTGLGGLLFMLVPMLAFWVGRSVVNGRTLRQLLWVIALGSVAAAMYGLFQQFVGFPSWDRRWIALKGYTALDVGGVIRAFGVSSSAQEYTVFLGMGIVALVALLHRGASWRYPLQLGAIALVAVADILESSRTSVVTTVVALGLMVAARAGFRFRTAILVGACSLALLLGVAVYFQNGQPATRVSPSASAGAGVSTSILLNHELGGLSDPFNQRESTLQTHIAETERGLRSAFTAPLGSGSGSVTLASLLAGGADTATTEDDLGNATVALGLVGLIAYLVVFVRGFRTLYGLALDRRDAASLAVLGIPIVALLQWLNGDLYSVAWLVWLVLGWADVQLRVTGHAEGMRGDDLKVGLAAPDLG